MHDCSSAIQSVPVYFTGLQSDVLNGLEVRFIPPLSTSAEVGMSTFFVCMTKESHKLWLVGNVLLWLMTHHQRSLSRALRNVSLRIDTLLILFCLMCGQWVYKTATSVSLCCSTYSEFRKTYIQWQLLSFCTPTNSCTTAHSSHSRSVYWNK